MDKEQVILERLDQLRQDQLKALKELKKVEKAKKKRRRRTAHGYPIKDNSSEQKKIHPVGERNTKCVFGTTPGRDNSTFVNREVGNNENQTPEHHGKLISLSRSERKLLKETGLQCVNEMVETTLKRQTTYDIDYHGLMTDDKAEIGNVKADCQTTIRSEETVSSTAETVDRKVTSKVTEVLDWMSFERMEDSVTLGKETVTGATCLTSPVTHNKETVIPDTCASCLVSPIAHNEETVIPDTCASRLTSSLTRNKETVIIPDTGATYLVSPITCNKKTVTHDTGTGTSCLTSSITCNKETVIISDTGASCLTIPITHNKETVIQPDTGASCPTSPITCNSESVIIIPDAGTFCLTSPITCNKETVIHDTDTSCLTSSIQNKETVIPDSGALCPTSPITCNKETVITDTGALITRINKETDTITNTGASCLTSPINCNKETVIRDADTSCLTSSIVQDKETVVPDTGASCPTSPITCNNESVIIPETGASCRTSTITCNKETVIRDTDTSCLTSSIIQDIETVIPDTGASCLTGSLAHKKRTVIPVPSVIPDYTGSSCPSGPIAHNKNTVTCGTGACCLIGSVTHCKKTVLPDVGASCLTDSIVHSKGTVNHNITGSCPTGSQALPRQTAPLQTEEDEHFRFPIPADNCLLKTSGLSDFVLPDKDFAMLKLEKLKQVRQSDLKEKTDVKFGKFDYQPDSDTNDSVVKCTNKNPNYCDDQGNDQGVYDSSQNTRNKVMLKIRKHDRNFESPCNVSPKRPPARNNVSFDDQFQNVFSESLLDVLGAGDQDFFTEKACDDCTWQADGKGTSGHHLSSDALSAQAMSDVGDCTNDMNSCESDGSTQRMSSNGFCGNVDRTIEERERCKNVSGLMFKQKAVAEDKQVEQSIITSSTLTISPGHHDEDVMNRAMSVMLDTPSDEKYVAENHNMTEYHSLSKVNKNEAGSGYRVNEMSEFCFQHKNELPWSSNEVRALKSLTLRNGETTSQIIAVCLPRLLVLWKSTAGSTWIVLNKWILNEEEELFELEITSVDSCVVVLVGGKFSKALGRVYCLLDRGDWNFDLCEEVSFPDIGYSDIIYEFKHMCLLPTNKSAENLSVVLACRIYDGRILLTKWKIDLMCFCIEDSKDFPQLCGSDLSSLLTVDGTKCLLLGCVDSDIYLWNYNSCELVCKTSLQHSAYSRPVCLSAETAMGMLFLVLVYEECKEVKLVAVNPQSERKACLKTLDMAQIIEDPSDKMLSCCKRGSFVISSFTCGNILLWNMASDKTKLLNLFSGDATCILLDHEESFIAFGTALGSVYLNIMK